MFFRLWLPWGISGSYRSLPFADTFGAFGHFTTSSEGLLAPLWGLETSVGGSLARTGGFKAVSKSSLSDTRSSSQWTITEGDLVSTLKFGGKTETFWCQCFSIDDARLFVCFRSSWTSCKVFRIADKESCSSFEDLGSLWGLGGGGDCSGPLRRPCFVLERDLERERWHDVSCSLRMNQRNYFLKEKQLLTLQTKNDSKGAEVSRDRPKSMKKCDKRNHLPVVVRSTR